MSGSFAQLVWLIAGTSFVTFPSASLLPGIISVPVRSDLGPDLVLAALNRGDKVIATARARSASQLDDLKARGAETLELDVYHCS